MKIVKKLLVKRMVKKIDPEIKVKFGRTLECEPTEKTIYVAFTSNEVDKKTFMDYVKEVNSKCKFDDLILGILHEIGHIFTYDEDDEEPYLQDTELLSKLYKEHLLTAEDVNYFYLRLPMESKATKWAIEFAMQNPQFTKYYQKRLCK